MKLEVDENPLNVEGSVWIQDKDSGEFVSGKIIDTLESGKQVKIRVDDSSNSKEDITLDYDKIERCNPVQFDKCEDMASLTFLNEPSVIHNLKLRYMDNLIYTYSGLFLVAINPYQQLNIYNTDFIKMYQNATNASNSNEDDSTSDKVKPHIFAVAQQAFNNLVDEKKDQSILVTGESGAGKTENTKRVIQYLISVASNDSNKKSASLLESQIIQANPILESFGNAQTIKNLNSSRFGKFVKININPSTKNLTNAHIDWYLLEKSRVVLQDTKERNYHIFYQFLKGASDSTLSKFQLKRSLNEYNYLKNSNQTVTGLDDKKEFQHLIKAFEVMGFSEAEQTNIFNVISIILHLGNITFNNRSMKDDTKQAILDDGNSPTAILAQLFDVSETDFKNTFLKQKVKAGREFITQQRNTSQAKFAIDALSKALYEKLFQFLVDKINESFMNNSNETECDPFSGTSDDPDNFIGILDIAGFEIFDKNSFEQLCINYTNEKLQQFFNHHMFVLEQSEYLKEGISWQYVDFGQELKPTIELMEGSQSQKVSIFSILNEECIVPKGTDQTFIEKLHDNLESKDKKADQSKIRYRPNKIRDGFVVKHYAGEVDYNISGWLDKNKDPLSNTIVDLLSSSSNTFISELFTSTELVENLSDSSVKGGNAVAKRGLFRTVAQRHKEQLTTLMKQLSMTHPHFVRCILPNSNKQSLEFNTKLVLDQLRCNGVLEGIRIARSGYPNRIEFKEFVDSYGILATSSSTSQSSLTSRKPKQVCELILNEMNLDPDVYKIGITKLFFRNGVLATLQKQKDRKLAIIITKLQSIIRGKLSRERSNNELMKLRASQVLMKNFKAYSEMNSDPWFRLVNQLKPMVVNVDGDQTYYLKKIQALEKQLEEFDSQRQSLESDKTSIAKTLEKLEADVKVDRDLLSSKDKELAETQKSKVLLEKEIADLKLEVDEKSSEVQNLKNENDGFNSKIESLVVETDALKAAAESKEIEFKSLQTKASKVDDSLCEKYNLAKSELSKAKAQIESLTKVNKALMIEHSSDELQKMTAKYKQLKHESKEIKELLDAKIAEEVKFDRGKQKYDKDISELKEIIQGLKQELEVERKSNQSLNKDLKVLQSDNEQLIKAKKAVDVKLASMNFKLSQRPELQSSSHSLSADIESLQTKLASESYENRQLRAQLSKYKGETAHLPMSHSASINRGSTSNEIMIERSANKRLEKLNIELQKELLQYKNNAREARGMSPMSVDYKTKYEVLKTKFKNLEDRLANGSNVLQESKSRNMNLGSSVIDPFVDKEMILAKQENLRLSSLLNENQTKLKRLQATSDSTFLQQEQLVQLKSKLQVTESQNSALQNSVDFYKKRAENYYTKIEAAEVAVQTAKRAEELTREELTETKARLAKAQREFKSSDLTVANLSSQIRELERDLSDKIFAYEKLDEMYNSLKDKYENEEEFRVSTSSKSEQNKDKELKMLNDDLVLLMGKETELNKQIKNISLQLEVSKKENRSIKNSNTELIKEKTQIERSMIETLAKNETLMTEQREHLFKLSTLKSQVEALKTSNEDLTYERDSLLEAKRTLEKNIESINEEFEKHLSKAKDDAINAVTVVNLSKQLKEERATLSNLQAKLVSYESKFSEYESNMESLNNESLMIIEENKTLTKFNQQLKSKVEDMEIQYTKERAADAEHWNSRVSELEDKLFIANSAKREEDQQLYNLQRSIKGLEYNNDIQAQSIKRYTEEIKNLEDSISRLDSNIKSLQRKEAEAVLQYKKSEREINNYKEKCLMLETELMDWRNSVSAN